MRRYYHWTFIDNFEWEEGMSAKFGIVELNYATQERKVRPSGLFYRDVCNNRGVTEGMLREHLPSVAGEGEPYWIRPTGA